MNTPKAFFYLFFPMFIAFLLAGCTPSGQEKTVGETTTNLPSEDIEYMYDWPAPTAELPGYQVFPYAYQLWVESFRYWIQADKPLVMNIGIQEIKDDTGFENHDGLKMYFAMDSLPELRADSIPFLILVPYDTAWVDGALYLDETAPNGYFRTVRQESNPTQWTLELIEEVEHAERWVRSWQGYIDTLYGFGPVYYYSFSTAEMNTAFSECAEMDLTDLPIRFGLHTVSPNDSTYSFGNKNVPTNGGDMDIAGYITPSILLANFPETVPDPANPVLLDFSSPCPKWCGQNDLWDPSERLK